ncbi:MAG: hypothetical protein WA061_06090 [Microgenomates group bacterium]
MHFAKLLKSLDISVENKGAELVISVKGENEKLSALEKKLGAIKELCCGEDGCCGEKKDGECC